MAAALHPSAKLRFSSAVTHAFTLPDADEQLVSLSDYAGRKVIVYFYPAALTLSLIHI